MLWRGSLYYFLVPITPVDEVDFSIAKVIAAGRSFQHLRSQSEPICGPLVLLDQLYAAVFGTAVFCCV